MSNALIPAARPSLWRRVVTSMRSNWTGPLTLKSPELARLFSDGQKTVSGINVTEANALTFSAVFDAVNQISSDVAKLPLNLYKRRPDGGADLYTESKLYRVLKYEPNPEMGKMTFWRTILAHALTYGNGYAEIERTGSGGVSGFWIVTPDRVRPWRDRDGALFYRVSDGSTGETVFAPKDMIHLPGPSFDGVAGYHVINLARQAIGLALAAEQFGASFFGNGSTFGGILTSDLIFTKDQAKDIRSVLEEIHQGPDRAHKLAVLWGGLKYNRLGVAPNEAQMNELRSRQVEEVARFFNIPVHKLKNLDRATNNNIEQQDLEYYKGPILNWTTLIEEELNRKAIPRPEWRQQYVRHNANAFLRGDIKSRYDALGIARDKGIINADEWRELEEMNPQPNGQGKVYLVQSAQIPVDLLPTLVESQIAKNIMKPDPPPPPVQPDASARAEQAEAELAALRARLDDATRAREASEARADATSDEVATLRSIEAERAQQVTAFASVVESLKVDILAAKEAEAVARAEAADAARLSAETDRAAVESRSVAEEALRTAADAEARVEEAERLRVASEASVQAAEARLADAESAREAALAEIALLEADALARVTAAEAAREEAQLAMAEAAHAAEAALAQAVAHETSAVTAGAGQAEAHQRAEEALSRAEAAESDRLRLAADLEAAAAREQAARDETDRLESERAALLAAHDADVQALDVMREDRRTESLEAESSRALALEAQARADAALQAAAEAQTALTEAKQAELDVSGALLAAHRSLVYDVIRRMIEREADRVRRNQATPDKLRTWMVDGYAAHAALMRQALAPVMAVRAAWMRAADSATVETDALVDAHVAESQRQIRAVLDGEAEDFGGTLSQVLHRWEQDRAAQIADRLMAEEVAYVRRRAA